MRFDTSQHMKLGQHMKLAPRMIQSMEILQLPMLALQERIEQELESNIALELVEPGSDGERDLLDGDDTRDDRLDRRELVVGDEGKESDDFERLSAFESNYSEASDNTYSSERYSASRSAGERDRKMDAMANLAARGESLTEQLLHQWSFTEVEPDIAALGERIIGYVDSDGLLGADMDTIIDQNRTIAGLAAEQMTRERWHEALHAVQHMLDPPGVAARDQRECLLLQIDALQADADDAQPWADARALIQDHFEDLVQNRLPQIERKSELSMQRIQAAMAMMRKLNLSPGRDLVDEGVAPIVPDVAVEYDEQSDSYIASLCDGIMPPLRVSPRYEQLAKDRSVDKDAREFITNNVRNAVWLIESINQRKNTLLRVVNVVLTRQREYFDHGPQHLRPLPMIEVADQLGIHVATVSRAVADKWMQTPRGMVPLRKFFSGGTETSSGSSMSWEAVKATLQEVVDAEDKSQPLNDDALAAELKKRGIDIARRTVVKYRQQLGIAPARRRKVYNES